MHMIQHFAQAYEYHTPSSGVQLDFGELTQGELQVDCCCPQAQVLELTLALGHSAPFPNQTYCFRDIS
jgi:hypothetical protein